jgi:hypothetical protein
VHSFRQMIVDETRSKPSWYIGMEMNKKDPANAG